MREVEELEQMLFLTVEAVIKQRLYMARECAKTGHPQEYVVDLPEGVESWWIKTKAHRDQTLADELASLERSKASVEAQIRSILLKAKPPGPR